MISIIIPVYNAVNYLTETVESILSQTYRDFEVIIVDDGSTDGSGELCDRLTMRDSRIIAVHKENGGVASARNRGLDEAKGDYIGWVDSDDIISPHMYGIMHDAAVRYDADVVQCSHTRDIQKLQNEIPDELPELEVLNNIESLKRIYRCHYTNACALWSKIYRRSLFDDLRFTEGTAFEDDEIVPQLIEKSKKTVFFELPLYCYIKRENSIITAPKQKNIMALTHHLDERSKRFKKLDEQLYQISLRHFYHYLKIKMCEKCFLDTPVQKQAVDLLKKYYSAFFRISNKYDKIALTFVKLGMIDFVANNGFEPIQNFLSKLKK